ncbi:MAG: hemerythrin family protein [Gammaproteobacteria bacterium]|nr:hemerythrin family protein [Gammaproteobacteria bacterium]
MNNDQSPVADPTGITPLDLEHRQLVEAINETCAELERGAARDAVLDQLGVLYVRVNAHFALEERLTRERSPEVYRSRKARYHDLLERVGAMMDAFYEGRCGACDQALGKCLLSWLEQHLKAGHSHLATPAGRWAC